MKNILETCQSERENKGPRECAEQPLSSKKVHTATSIAANRRENLGANVIKSSLTSFHLFAIFHPPPSANQTVSLCHATVVGCSWPLLPPHRFPHQSRSLRQPSSWLASRVRWWWSFASRRLHRLHNSTHRRRRCEESNPISKTRRTRGTGPVPRGCVFWEKVHLPCCLCIWDGFVVP